MNFVRKLKPETKKIMNPKMLQWTGTLALCAALFTVPSCSTTDGFEETDLIETPQGAIIVDTVTMTATVTAVDSAKRKVTLVSPSGHKTTYQCGPAVANFAQIQVGDKVQATVTEQAAVFLGQGQAPSATVGAGVALAPIGAKPGGEIVQTTSVTAKITKVEAKQYKVTLQLPDGSTRRVKVGKQVNLAAVQPGDNVTVQLTEGLAITVVKP
jgi:hypothetical protein